MDFKPRSQGPLPWKRGIVDFRGIKFSIRGKLLKPSLVTFEMLIVYMISYLTETDCQTEQLAEYNSKHQGIKK